MKTVVVNDTMQHGYRYKCTAPIGRSFDVGFKPDLSPAQMLKLGVFGGKYLNDCKAEFPTEWFKGAKLSKDAYDINCNFFKIKASQSLSVWQRNGWIYKDDPRGWFQWYCRYYMGRRIPTEDARQIKRWKAITRHIAQVRHNCLVGDSTCRPRQRQALLHWAIDSRAI